MPTKLILAILTITLALIFYTIGVFGERRKGILQKQHIIIFWLGFLFDTIGTSIMSSMAQEADWFSAHGITGIIAIILMLFHAIWATVVYFRGTEEKQKNFHKFSIVVWLFWLIPYILGMFIGMGA